jgi:hypothetical protein
MEIKAGAALGRGPAPPRGRNCGQSSSGGIGVRRIRNGAAALADENRSGAAAGGGISPADCRKPRSSPSKWGRISLLDEQAGLVNDIIRTALNDKTK